jgi:hypothetical protein
MPGPVLFGAFIDKTCNLWEERCDETGACLEYDNAQLSYLILAAGLLFQGKDSSTLLFMTIAVIMRGFERQYFQFFFLPLEHSHQIPRFIFLTFHFQCWRPSCISSRGISVSPTSQQITEKKALSPWTTMQGTGNERESKKHVIRDLPSFKSAAWILMTMT